jgi:hypothetical protein
VAKDLLVAGAVDSLTILAYSHFVVDDRLSYSLVYNYLERTLPILALIPAESNITFSSISQPLQPLRLIASTFYKIGGTLYNHSKPESAVKFLSRSCEIGRAVLSSEGKFERSESEREILGGMKQFMSNRWDLLALCYHNLGEKRVSLVVTLSYLLSY